MNRVGAGLAFVLASIGEMSFAQDLAQISPREVAADHCPAEWSALIALEPDHWADMGTFGIDPVFTQAETDAFNKYGVEVIALAEHFATLIAFKDATHQTLADFEKAKAIHDLFACLKLTPAERDLMIAASLRVRPAYDAERLRAGLFEAIREYECMNFPEASAQIFALDPQSETFSADYDRIMSTVPVVCD